MVLMIISSSPVLFAGIPDKVYAVWYSVGENADAGVIREDMKKIAGLGFNSVFFPAYVWQSSATSAEVEPPNEQYLKTLGATIDAARENGLAVTVTGFLLVRDGAWRGTILPVSKKKWAESYAAAIGPHLDLAESKRADAFCIASEMESLKTDEKAWKYVLAQSRKRYSGPVGFNVNWWHNQTGLMTVTTRMNWMQALDFIGLSGYFELTDGNSPTREALVAAWSGDRHGQNLVEQFAAIKTKFAGKKMFLWEIGYRSLDGTNMQPWNWSLKADADPGEQADCFAAFLSVFPKTALDGFAIWDLAPGLNPNETGYSFMGKPAEKVIMDFLKSAGSPVNGK